MTQPGSNSLEVLEQRIAPAGLITVDFTDGRLTINGADGENHEVEIVKTGRDTFRVDGIGTAINDVGQTSESFTGVLKHVSIDGGSGADTFRVTKLRPLKSFSFDGNAGVDSLSTTGLKTRINGIVDISLGADTGAVTFAGNKTALHGSLDINLGGGGTATFDSLLTTVDGNVAITGGAGNDSVAVTGDTTRFKSNFSFAGGDGNNSFGSSGLLLKVRGFAGIDGGAGTDTLVFAADKNNFGNRLTPGLVDLNLGGGPGTISFAGNGTKVLGDLQIDLGSGGGSAELKSGVTTVRDHVQVAGGAGDDTLKFDGQTSIGGDLSFVGGNGDDALIARGGLFAVTGPTTMVGGVGESTFDLDVITLAVAGLSVTGGTANDTVSIIADGTITGDADLQLGLDGIGPSSTTLQSRAGVANGLNFGGTLTIDMVGSTVDVLKIANIQVARAFVAQTGENVSTVDISSFNGNREFTLKTGAGADVVNIDNVNARAFNVDTESGADELRIERNLAFPGTSQIRGIATILTGIGADQIRIGNSIDSANLSVSFARAMTLDAGDGANMRNDILASNTFQVAPTITATGGTLTETAAV